MTTTSVWWSSPCANAPINATVIVPGSKSLTNRHLLLAASAQQESVIRGALLSRDSALMIGALRALAHDIRLVGGASPDIVVRPAATMGPATIDCGLAGTVMRFVPPFAALAHGDVKFIGDPHAKARPMDTLLGALHDIGVDLSPAPGGWPLTVHGRGRVRGGTVTLDASASSQFVSGLLLAAPGYEEGIDVTHVGPPMPSAPHVSMTLESLRDAGAYVEQAGPFRWLVQPSTLNGLDVQVEPDLSSAAPFLAAAVVTGGTVEVPHWPTHTTQAGDHLRDVLTRMGADVALTRNGLRVSGPGAIQGADLNLRECGELVPVIAAIAAFADSPTTITGVGHLRGHETDRLLALETELNRLGGAVQQTGDGLHISPKRLVGNEFHTYHDHRMAQAGAVIGLVVPNVRVENIATTDKTLPGFADMWSALITGSGPVRPAVPDNLELFHR